jgi:sugar lactone lactonase YvrE
MPESALYDPKRDEYLVSNVAGGDLEENDAGFISRVSPDGVVSELRFIDGASSEVVLNAPKGLALSGDELFVADISVVRSFDRNSGKPARKIAIMSASFLNDVAAAPDGTLYVSDTGLSLGADGSSLVSNGSDAIYVIDARGVVDVLIQGPELGQPNGLLADGAGVWVVNRAGELYRVSRAGERTPVAALPGGGLDGLVQTGTGRLLVSSWDHSTVYLGQPPSQPTEAFTPMILDLKTPADLGYDTKRSAVIVPLYAEDSLYVQEVPGG